MDLKFQFLKPQTYKAQRGGGFVPVTRVCLCAASEILICHCQESVCSHPFQENNLQQTIYLTWYNGHNSITPLEPPLGFWKETQGTDNSDSFVRETLLVRGNSTTVNVYEIPAADFRLEINTILCFFPTISRCP